MLPALPGHDRRLDPPDDATHHQDCPKAPPTATVDDVCFCPDLYEADRLDAAERRNDEARGG